MMATMNPNHRYAYEKFSSALGSLAIGPGDVRGRLWAAYLHFHPVREKHLPDDLHEDYQWVLQQLTRYGPARGRDGKIILDSIQETLRRIRNSTGSRIAERILRIYSQLNWLYMEDAREP